MHGTGGFIHLPPRPPGGLMKYLEDSEARVPMALDSSHELQGRIATRLLAEAAISLPSGMGETLSQHFCSRLNAVKDAAEEASSFFYRPGQDEGWGWPGGHEPRATRPPGPHTRQVVR